MTDNTPPGANDRTDAPYNYDPEQVMVECDNCGEFIKVAMADQWKEYNFCPNEVCMDLFINE